MALTAAQRAAKRELYKRDYLSFAEQQLKIKSIRPGEMLPLILNDGQRMLHEKIERQRKQLGYVRAVLMKGRQLGGSTYSQSRLFHSTVTTRNFNTLLIALDEASTSKIFDISRTFFDFMGDDFRPMIRNSNKRELVWENPDKKSRGQNQGLKSRMDFQQASQVNAGTGTTRQGLHLCLRGDALVLLADGNAVPIEQVQIGDTVVTHTGAHARVKAVASRKSIQGWESVVEVRTWLNANTLSLTAKHEVFTPQGKIAAGKLKPGDEIGIAIQPITGTLRSLLLPRRIRKRGRGGPKVIEGEVQLTNDFGFAVGYYLAEGCATDSHLHRAASITYAHHREEIFVKRAIAGCQEYFTSTSSRDIPGCLTTATTVYGSSLAQFFVDHFGRTDEKRIPHWIFEAPREFVEGLVCGYLAGDGSKGLATHGGYACPSIAVTSVRVRLLIQLRRLIASLGWGWASLNRKAAFVDKRGWKCKEAWTLHLNGRCAIAARRACGMEVPKDSEIVSRRRKWTEKYRMENGRIWQRVRSVKSSSAELVYDLEVDHPDHSFETIVGAVANSEIGKWRPEDIKILMSSLMPTIHHVEDTFVIFESTAYVYGEHFREMCDRARSGKSEYVFCFVPWWLDRKNQVPLLPGEKLTLDKDEKFLVKLAAKGQPKDDIPPHEMRPEQLKWRRVQVVELQEMFDQEYPYDYESAWISLDVAVFNRSIMYEMRQTVVPPKRFLDFDEKGRLITVKVNGDVHADEDYIAVWEDPIPGVQYDIGADPSNGIPGADWSAAQVVRRDTHEQVAEYHKCRGAVDFGVDLYWLGKHYNTAHLAVEMTGPGYNTSDQLHKMFYPDLYRWRNRDRAVQTYSQLTGWKTQRDSKQLMVTRTQHMLNHRQLTIHSKCLWNEMHDFCRVGPEDYRGSGNHDDLVVSYLITIQVAEDENIGTPAAPPPLVPQVADLGPAFRDTRKFGAEPDRVLADIMADMKGE